MEKVIAMCIEAYIKVYGLEKWNSLTEEQQHDVIMTLARELSAAVDRIDA